MTISPPANVKEGPGEVPRILAYGIDSLSLSLDLAWPGGTCFDLLDMLKEQAKTDEKDVCARVTLDDDNSPWLFAMKSHGAGGYDWLMIGCDMTMKLSRRLMPGSRPNAVIDIRSEALWLHTPSACVARVCDIVKFMGAQIVVMRASRADLCVDVLLPASEWTPDLKKNMVKRAADVTTYEHHDKLQGFGIGRGAISARF
jgi:hypothetical protein